MLDTQSGAYTKTGAYNFLKGLLGLSKKDLINKKFFTLFFTESDGFYTIKKSEDLVKSIFTKEGIVELNKLYFEKISSGQQEEAREIKNKIITSVASLLSVA